MASGIYLIRNIVNGKIYIGSSIDMRRRWVRHRFLLEKGVHHSRHLQGAWDAYGGQDGFIFMALEHIEDRAEMLEREQFWLDSTRCTNPARGYNIAKSVTAAGTGLVVSDATRAKISAAKKGVKKAPFTAEHRRNMVIANRRGRPGRRLLNDAQIAEIKSRLANGEKGAALAREFSVNDSIITKVKQNGYRPAHVPL